MSDPTASRPNAGFFARTGRLWLLGFALLNVVMFWRVHEFVFDGYGDFASLYTAGKIVRIGQAAHLYDRELQWKIQQQFAAKVQIRRGPLPYIRPPFEALLFLPFTYLPYPAAYKLWLAANLVLLLSLPLLVPRFDDGHSSLVLQWLLCLAYFPAAFCLIQGQDAILLLIILVLTLRLLLREAELGCGAVLGLGLFKFHLLLPLLAILLLRKKFRAVAGFLITAAAIFVVSVLMVHWTGLLGYPVYLWNMNEVPGLGMVTKTKSMPNPRGLLALLFRTWHFPMIVHFVLGAIICAGIIGAARKWRGGDRRSTVAAYCCWIAVILATAYYSNSYDLTLLLLPLSLFVNGFWESFEFSGWRRRLFLLATGLLLCTPLLWILALPVDQFGWTALIVLGYAVAIS